jgi:hypothetical protein
VISHVPSFKDILKIPNIAPTGGADPSIGLERRLGYARRLCGALKDLDLPWVPPPESIVNGSRRTLLLLTLELFWSLPKCASARLFSLSLYNDCANCAFAGLCKKRSFMSRLTTISLQLLSQGDSPIPGAPQCSCLAPPRSQVLRYSLTPPPHSN